MTHVAISSSIRYVRSTREIAKALGFKLRGGRLRKKCEEIAEWIKRPDFPEKQRAGKGGARRWALSEVIEWATKYAAELAPQKQMQSAVLEILSTDRPTKRALDALRQLGASSMPSLVSGMEGIASILANHFHVDCRRQYVHAWRKGQKLPAGAPPFPPPDGAGRYNVAECLAWYEHWQFRAQNGNGQTPDLFADLPNRRAEAELKKLDHEQWVRNKERGGWMEIAQHNRILAGLGKQIWTPFCELVEVRLVENLDALLRDTFATTDESNQPSLADFERLRTRIITTVRERHKQEIDNLQRHFESKVKELKREESGL